MEQPHPWKTPIIAAVIISLAGAGAISFLRKAHQELPVTETPVVQAEAPAPVVEEQTPPATPEPPKEEPKPEPAPETKSEPKPEAKPQPKEEVKPAEKPAPAAPAAKASGPATLTGKAVLKGAAPNRKAIKMDADPHCAELHDDKPMLTEDVVANADGTLQNVFVYVKSGLEGKVFPLPKDPVKIDQVGCHYIPHVLGIRAKQPLVIRNSDNTLHNVHILPGLNKEKNIGMPNAGMEAKHGFPVSEVMVKFKCDVHPWMSAYIGVLDHPFFTVTDDKGSFTIKDLPPGDYTLEAWHETLGTQEQRVKMPAQDVTFTFGK